VADRLLLRDAVTSKIPYSVYSLSRARNAARVVFVRQENNPAKAGDAGSPLLLYKFDIAT